MADVTHRTHYAVGATIRVTGGLTFESDGVRTITLTVVDAATSTLVATLIDAVAYDFDADTEAEFTTIQDGDVQWSTDTAGDYEFRVQVAEVAGFDDRFGFYVEDLDGVLKSNGGNWDDDNLGADSEDNVKDGVAYGLGQTGTAPGEQHTASEVLETAAVDPGNVHLPTAAQVEDGVMFGPASATEGEFAGGSPTTSQARVGIRRTRTGVR